MEIFRPRMTGFLAFVVLPLLTVKGETACTDADASVCPDKAGCYRPKGAHNISDCVCVSEDTGLALNGVLEKCVAVKKSSGAGGLKGSFPVSLVFMLITLTAIA